MSVEHQISLTGAATSGANQMASRSGGARPAHRLIAQAPASMLVVLFIREPRIEETGAGKAGGAPRDTARELRSNLRDVFTGERSLRRLQRD